MAQIIWMLMYSLNKHPKYDDTNHPHLGDFRSQGSYIENNHHESSKIVKPTKNIILDETQWSSFSYTISKSNHHKVQVWSSG